MSKAKHRQRLHMFLGLDCNIFENCLCRSASDFSSKPYILSFFHLKNNLKEKSGLQSLFILYTDLKPNKLNSWHKYFFFYFVLRGIVKLSNRKSWANASGRSWFWLTEADCTLWYLVVDTLGKKEWQCVHMFLSDEKWHFVLISLTRLDSGNPQSTGLHWSASRLRWCYIE